MADGRQRSEKLYLLQQTDSALDTATEQVTALRAGLGEAEALIAARTDYLAAEAALTRDRGALKELETTSADVLARSTALEKKLYGGLIHGTKEIETAQHDIAGAKARVTSLDDQSLDLMSAVEERTAAYAATRKKLIRAQNEWKAGQADTLAQIAALETEITRLNDERAARIAPMPPADFARYEKVRQQHQGLAVVLVVNFVCQKCHVTQPLIRQKELKQAADIIVCSNCGRILYWK